MKLTTKTLVSFNLLKQIIADLIEENGTVDTVRVIEQVLDIVTDGCYEVRNRLDDVDINLLSINSGL